MTKQNWVFIGIFAVVLAGAGAFWIVRYQQKTDYKQNNTTARIKPTKTYSVTGTVASLSQATSSLVLKQIVVERTGNTKAANVSIRNRTVRFTPQTQIISEDLNHRQKIAKSNLISAGSYIVVYTKIDPSGTGDIAANEIVITPKTPIAPPKFKS